MLSSICRRRFNPIPIRILFSFSFSTQSVGKPTSYFHQSSPKVQPISHNFDQNTICETLSCYGSDWKKALDFFNWVETDCNFAHTTDTYNRMIDILGKFFEFDLSWDLIRRMRENPFSVPNHATFRIMFKRYVSAQSVQEAIDTYDKLEEFNLKDYTSYCYLVDALCEYKHVIEAYEFCFGRNQYADFNGNATKIFNMILRGWFKIGWWGKCREFWEEMDKKGVVKDLHSYSIYMDIVCKGGKPWKAVKLYKELKSKGIKLDVVAYNTVIRAIGLSEGVDFSLRVYHEMKELGCEPNVVTCNIIIKLLCENGRMKEAYKMLYKMHKTGSEPDVITYHCFFRCLEDPKMILRLFDRMIENGVRPKMDTYVMLITKFGRWGFLRPVFIVWEKMKELGCSPDEFAYNAFIDVLIQKDMIGEARKYDEEMLAKGLSPKPRKELGTKLEL
ncbi:pentatricopeptide repeat-containing protein [Tripterygium wilfordii]|uniref:Pentatricopeptide repeat-containing protein n=1 Tax=Tripterygium wilfordii TaxID=458696 RepID=A0A7J7BYM9_TRIWF|nr:pentatricopeptide repeat-containing protein At1g80550, mitochondrial [Tripterygium wilfordii]KAF5726962.1 pentatricopeptide repeat-containing protein [Tripterygium wilfordii]